MNALMNALNNALNAPEFPSFWILLLKATALLSLSLLACGLLRRAASSARHGILLCALIAVALLPLSLLIPREASLAVRFSSFGYSPTLSAVLTSEGRKGDESGVGALLAAPFVQASEGAASSAPTVLPSSVGERGERAADTTTQRLIPTTQYLLMAYLAGVIVILLRLTSALFHVRGIFARAVPFDALETAEICRRVGLRGAVVALCSEGVAAPMMFGWRRAAILLPADAPEWPAERRTAALLHEAAHIARRDWPALMFSHLVCALYWFHPLAWVVAARLRAEAERAADDRVLLAGVPAPEYARHLLEIARSLTSPHAAPSAALAMADAPPMEGRLRALLDAARPRRPSRRAVFAFASAVVAAFFLVILVRPVAEAQTPPLTPPKQRDTKDAEQIKRAHNKEKNKKNDMDVVNKQMKEMLAQRERMRLQISIERIKAQDAGERWRSSEETAAFLEAQIREYKARLATTERALAEYRRANAGRESANGPFQSPLQAQTLVDLSALKQEQDYLNVTRGDLQHKMAFLRERIAFINEKTKNALKGQVNPNVFAIGQQLAEATIAEKAQAERMKVLTKEIQKYEQVLREQGRSSRPQRATPGIRDVRVFDITYPPNGALPARGAPHRIRIIATDAFGTRTIYDQTKKAGEMVTLRSKLVGEGVSLRIYDNGELKAEVNK